MKSNDFYRLRLEHFDKERRIFKEYVDIISPTSNELHNLSWENKKLENRSDEINEEILRYDNEISKLTKQKDSIKAEIQSMEIAKTARYEQISRLSKFKAPVSHDTTYLVDEKFPNKQNQGRQQQQNSKHHHHHQHNKENYYNFTNQLVKPTKNGELLQLEKNLIFETSKVKAFQNDLIDTINDIIEKRYQYRLQRKYQSTYDILPAKEKLQLVIDTEFQTFLAVSELLRMRLDIMIAQREKVDEVEKLEHEKNYFIKKEENTKTQLLNDLELLQKRMKTELQESNAVFQKQLSEYESTLSTLHEKADWIMQNHATTKDHDTIKLTEAIKQAKARYEKLQIRNNLDMEGYRTELNQLRSRLQQVEKLYKAFLIHRKTDEINKAAAAAAVGSSSSSSTGDGGGDNGRHISKNSSGIHDVTSDIDEY